MLEAPPTEYPPTDQDARRCTASWAELLNAAEAMMALPCSRAWLDLQRFVVEACVALGEDYNAIAIAIRSELRTLLRDLPQLIDATLSDDTPAANAQTQAWLQELMAEPAGAAPVPNGGSSAAGIRQPRLAEEVHRSARPRPRSGAHRPAAEGRRDHAEGARAPAQRARAIPA